MIRILTIAIALLFAGCTSFGEENPYQEEVLSLQVQASYPEGYTHYTRSGVQITVKNIATGTTYGAQTDDQGCATLRIPRAVYRVSLSDKADSRSIFNGMLEEVRLTGEDMRVDLPLDYLRAGVIVIKELYFGGCSKAPAAGTQTNDQYVVLHNNGTTTEYLDGLCLGMVDPMTSAGQNKWVTLLPSGEVAFPEFAPISECVWRFQGAGTDFPLKPGEDAVVAIRGARDFAAEFPLSVNLNKAEYFVCHSRQHFTQEALHFDPGDRILPTHILGVAKKTGVSVAYVMAVNSPAVVIFRPENDFDFNAYLADDSRSVATQPGGTTKCVKVPWEWIYDGVEVFFGAKNNKRIAPKVDVGGAKFSATLQGRTLHRRLDAEATAKAGYEVYIDTNNSSTDFEERATQSLHDK